MPPYVFAMPPPRSASAVVEAPAADTPLEADDQSFGTGYSTRRFDDSVLAATRNLEGWAAGGGEDEENAGGDGADQAAYSARATSGVDDADGVAAHAPPGPVFPWRVASLNAYNDVLDTKRRLRKMATSSVL